MDPKYAAHDCVLADGTAIPAGTQLMYVPYAMGRDPTRYEDPLAFKPERWIPFKAPSQYEFPVFQAGPRVCLGMDMALFEAKLLTCMLLQRFSFAPREGEADKISYGIGVTMCICNNKDARDPDERTHELWLVPTRRRGGGVTPEEDEQQQ